MPNMLFHVFLVALAIPSACAAADDWTRFGGPTGNYQFDSPFTLADVPTKRWQRTLGEGMSSVITKDGLVYATYLVPFDVSEKDKKEAERTHREAIIALDAENGQTRWHYQYESGWLESQEAFGGRPRAPQATPAICGDYLLTLGFTGILNCLDRVTGDIVWKKNVVQEFAAIPVQFGFSASPLPMGDRVVVLVGGAASGLICLEAKTGRKIWNVPCKEASYSTPVLWERPEGRQIVFMTRNRIIGVKAETGEQLWEYLLPESELTNVPTPMLLDDSGLLISGQGVKGIKRLNIVRGRQGFEVTEAWTGGSQFFYCNWVRHGSVLWGCDGSLLIAIELSTGEVIGRFRGFIDANLLLSGDQMLVFHGDGHLSELEMSDLTVKVKAKYAVLEGRCWTPCTPCGNYLYCRGENQLLCLDLVGGDRHAAVVSAKVRQPVLKFRSKSQDQETIEPMQLILSAFESGGKEAAWKAYEEHRILDPDALTFQQRNQLADMATHAGLHEFAKLIMAHAAADFPEEIERAIQTPSSETNRGDNGLVYLEFAIRNNSKQTIQAYVKGPTEHPFSYGLPLPSGKVRLENWPVGTQLFRTELGISKEVMLTVEEKFAGKTIDLPPKK